MRFRRMLLNILQGKTRGKNPYGKNPLEKKRIASSYNNIKGGTLMRSHLVVFQGVKECLQLGGSGEEESGHKGRMVYRMLNLGHVG